MAQRSSAGGCVFMKKVRVLHVSTAHQPQDPRVVFKQCRTLAEHYEVFCALPRADSGLSPAIRFIRLPYFRRVIWRTFLTCPLILIRCLPLRPKLVHVYVPEFLPFAYLFQLLGARIIYEVQENLHKKIHLKTYNNGFLLRKAFFWFDHFAQRHFYLIFTEHSYLTTYTALTKPHVVIYNYPSIPFLEPFRQPYKPNPEQPVFFYIGWLSFERAFDTLVEALAQLKLIYPAFRLALFGQRLFTDAHLNQVPCYNIIRENLHFYGYTDQRIAFLNAHQATAGLALLKPWGDYPDSYPTKLFEYMALGLPVITSDFPLYQAIVEQHNCGFCVSPDNPTAVAEKMLYLIMHPNEAREMGERGRRAVEQLYNWSTEASKLVNFYKRLLN